jgi:ABC-type multidrug transport system ATPase subunit
VLVLDDATSAIDVQVELQIHDGLKRMMAGRTTLIIAHRLSTISLADRVLLMDEGRIVADGTHVELMATVPLYAEVLAQAEDVDPDQAAAPEPPPDEVAARRASAKRTTNPSAKRTTKTSPKGGRR